jgi:ABC-type dipeptide/oligopeptide/nickel transport system permease subunit
LALLKPPTWFYGKHPLGTGPYGHDTLSQLMVGARLLVLRCGALGLIVGIVGLGLRLGRGHRSLDGPRLVTAITVALVVAVLAEAIYGFFALYRLVGLGFVGTLMFGATAPPTLSWGSMILESWPFAPEGPWTVAVPLMSLLVVALGFGLLGSGLVDILTRRRNRYTG